MFNLSLSDFQRSICHGSIMTSFITRDWWQRLVTFWGIPAPSLAMCFWPGGRREERAMDLWGRDVWLPKQFELLFREEKAGLYISVLLPHVRTLIFADCRSLWRSYPLWTRFIGDINTPFKVLQMAKLIDIASGSGLIYASLCWFAHYLRVLHLSLNCNQ